MPTKKTTQAIIAKAEALAAAGRGPEVGIINDTLLTTMAEILDELRAIKKLLEI